VDATTQWLNMRHFVVICNVCLKPLPTKTPFLEIVASNFFFDDSSIIKQYMGPRICYELILIECCHKQLSSFTSIQNVLDATLNIDC